MLREVGAKRIAPMWMVHFSLFPANEDDPDHVLLTEAGYNLQLQATITTSP